MNIIPVLVVTQSKVTDIRQKPQQKLDYLKYDIDYVSLYIPK